VLQAVRVLLLVTVLGSIWAARRRRRGAPAPKPD
jgi:hypothetical protein